MNKLNIVCPAAVGSSGYGRHGRGLALGLSKYFDVALEINLVNGWENMVPDAIRKMVEKDYVGEDTICVTMPSDWVYRRGLANNNKRVFGCGVWEGDRVPFSFAHIAMMKEFSQVWVPSNHTREAYFRRFDSFNVSDRMREKIRVVPHGVDLEVFRPKPVSDEFKELREKFDTVFFFNGGWRYGLDDRKGLAELMLAYCSEFKPEDKTVLVCKINGAYINQGWDVKEEIAKLRLPPRGKRGEIQIVVKNMNDEQLAEMYNMSDVHVITSKAEAFCFPLLESMACGRPVITNDFGGQMDYCNENNSWICKSGDLYPATDPNVYYRETAWRRPQLSEIRKALRAAHDGVDARKLKGKMARGVARKFSWANTAKVAKSLLE